MFFFHALFGGASHLTQVLSLLQLAFTVWMMVDAYHRGVETYWYWVILFFQPIGAWVYFFAVKLRTLRWPQTGRRLTRSPQTNYSFKQLQYLVEHSPTVANRIALAERLMEKGKHSEAIPLLEAVLAVEPDYAVALHDLAECRLAAGIPDQAVAPLEKLLQRDPCWADYRAWRTLLAVHQARGQPADGLAACREFVKRLPTLENKCRLAEHLLDNEKEGEAAHLLEDALDEQEFAPWSARWGNWRWTRQARRLLAEVDVREKERNNTKDETKGQEEKD